MRFCPVPGIRVLLLGLLAAGVMTSPPALGQEVGEAVKEAYFRAVAEHFKLPMREVSVVGDWNLEPDEVPVVLFVAHHAGVSPDALIGLRKRGRSWREVASRFGLDVRSFHIPLPKDVPLGSLDRAYGEFRGRPHWEWNQIELNDLEIVCLVNLRVLSEEAGVPPLRILRSRDETGSFVAAFATLGGTAAIP